MAGASDATEWNQLSACYLLEAALQARRNSDLYLVALDCAARHPGAIERLAATVDDGAAARATRNADAMFASCSRFLGELARIASGAEQSPPELRGGDVATWTERLTNYMNDNGLVAHPEACPAPASRKVLQFGRAWFELLGALTRIGTDAEEQELRHLLAQLDALKHPPPMILLRARPGQTIATDLRVQNTRAAREIVACRVPTLRSVNGVGAAFTPAIRIEPNDFPLDPAEEASVRLTFEVTPADFMPDNGYVGEVHLRCGAEPEVRIPLRLDTGTPP